MLSSPPIRLEISFRWRILLSFVLFSVTSVHLWEKTVLKLKKRTFELTNLDILNVYLHLVVCPNKLKTGLQLKRVSIIMNLVIRNEYISQ